MDVALRLAGTAAERTVDLAGREAVRVGFLAAVRVDFPATTCTGLFDAVRTDFFDVFDEAERVAGTLVCTTMRCPGLNLAPTLVRFHCATRAALTP